MSEAVSQIMNSLQDTNAAFHARMPVASFHEPGFVFVFQTGFGTITALGEDDSLHTQIVSQLFIRFGKETPVATRLLGRLVKGFEMRFQAGLPLLLIAWVAFQ